MRLAAGLALLVLAGVPASAQQVLVDEGSPLRWIANSADPGIGLQWTRRGFDDRAWAAGEFGIGYEAATGAENLLRTVVPPDTVSLYARTRFDVPDPSAITSLALGLDHDDGVIAWLNGVEIWRSAEMPAGDPAWNEDSSQHESSNGVDPDFTPYRDVSAAALPALRGGENELAIGAWNASVPSSDLVLVAQLVANPAPALSRGPYLQLATPTAMTIRWRTLSPSDSVVRWGDAPGNLVNVVTVPGSRTEHEVRLTGLRPATRAYYSVGMTGLTLAGGDASHHFTTPPLPGERSPFRAWVIGDSGTANADARRVRDAFAARQAGEPPDLWLMLGDNAYTDGTDPQYQRAVFDTYPEQLRQSPVWPTFGNHDALSASATTQSGAYFDAFTLPSMAEAGGIASGTEAYWSFDWANVHWVCLDSQESDRSPTGAMADWLRRDLASTTQEWIVAYFHHPPYTKGTHDSDTESRHVGMRGQVLPILEEHGVDLVLGGHSHSYERSFLVDGHHGDSATLLPGHAIDPGDGSEAGDGAYLKPLPGLAPRSGEVCVVAGSSGQVGSGPLDHPVMVVSLEVLGSLVLDFAGDRLDAVFLDDAGAQRDAFTIIKAAPASAEHCSNGLDDDADMLLDCEDPDCLALDTDGDGIGDCSDCAPAHAGARGLPPEIPLLRAERRAAGEALLRWTDVRPAAGSALVSDVATGEIGELLSDRDLRRSACLARDLAGFDLADARPAPSGRDGHWYLVRSRNTCGAGPWGTMGATLAGCP